MTTLALDLSQTIPLSRGQFMRLFDELRLLKTELVGEHAVWHLQGGVVVTLITAEERFVVGLEEVSDV